jgi:hypothetical protein
LVVIVVLGSVAAYQQFEIVGLNSSVSHLEREVGGPCGVYSQTGTLSLSCTSSQVVSSVGLGLNLSVSSAIIGYGDTIYANASLFNTLDSNLTLDLSPSALVPLNDWAKHTSFVCGSNWPVQMAVFDGYYTDVNISSAGEPLQLGGGDSVDISCVGVLPPNRVVFLPDSGAAYGLFDSNPAMNSSEPDSLSLGHWLCVGEDGSFSCVPEEGASGYYTSNGFLLFHYGVYTIAAMDAWGDVAVVHFVVQ